MVFMKLLGDPFGSIMFYFTTAQSDICETPSMHLTFSCPLKWPRKTFSFQVGVNAIQMGKKKHL